MDAIEFVAYWQDASSTTIRTDVLGTAAPSGGAISADSILPPATATKVVVRARGKMTSWDNGSTVQLFADALAVTVP